MDSLHLKPAVVDYLEERTWPRLGGHYAWREKDDRSVYFRSELFKYLLIGMGSVTAEHVFYGENTEGVGGDMQGIASLAARMVGHYGMAPERLPMPATMTQTEEKEARKKLNEYLEDTGGKLLAVASLERPLRAGPRPAGQACARRAPRRAGLPRGLQVHRAEPRGDRSRSRTSWSRGAN